MAKIPALQRLLVEDFPDQAQWIQKLISPVNDFMENSIYALTRNLSFFDNMAAQVQNIQVQGSTVFAADITLGSAFITALSTTVGFLPNMAVAGLGIPPSTKISAFANKSYILGNTTLASNVITNIGSTTNLLVGQPIIGDNILPASTIVSIDSSSQIHISAAALATVSNLSLYCPAIAVMTAPATETDYGISLVGGGAYPISFSCNFNSAPSFLWVASAVEKASNPKVIVNPVYCDWSYVNGSILIDNITGLEGSLVSSSPRTFNLSLLVVRT